MSGCGAEARESARGSAAVDQHECDSQVYHRHVEALQKLQPEPPPVGVQHWKLDPIPDMHCAPEASWQLPQLHELEHTSTPHPVATPAEFRSQPVRVAPGEQTPPPEQVVYPLHAPHPHVESQVRVRVWRPQFPQACSSISVWPGVHSPAPPPTQVNAPHVQSALQVRCSVPHPHAPPVSVAPGVQIPSPVHAPSFTHVPPTQTWRCVPQRPQGIVRGAEPSAQSHVVGASHSPHTPSMQSRRPAPQLLVQSLSMERPTPGSASSQSIAAGTPSSSASSSPETHTPSRQT